MFGNGKINTCMFDIFVLSKDAAICIGIIDYLVYNIYAVGQLNYLHLRTKQERIRLGD